MRRELIFSLAAASLLATPAQAMTSDSFKPGAFIGARLRLPLGKKIDERPLAGLTIAPTMSRISSDGRLRTTFGEGLALNFGRNAKPALTLAGKPAGQAIGLKSEGKTDTGQKLGISTVGWAAIGVTVVAVAGGAYFVHLAIEADKNSE